MRSPLVVLRVRREQLARLSDEQVADFVGEIAPYICEVFAAEVERVAGGAPEAWMAVMVAALTGAELVPTRAALRSGEVTFAGRAPA